MNKPKYEKPVMEDLSDVQIAQGACQSGGQAGLPSCPGGDGGAARRSCSNGSSAWFGCGSGSTAG